MYVITRQGGETVRATLNNNNINSWIDVAVDLGHPPVAEVHGLLGNANGNTSEDGIATRNGTVLTEPVSFTDLYHSYADSWRVAAANSLLCADKKIKPGIPAKPFYANDLDPQASEHARAICTAAGVTAPALLDACMLDTAVLGGGDDTAARVYTRAVAPRAVLPRPAL